MRSSVAWQEGEATFTIQLGADDPGRRGHATMSRRSMRVRLPFPLGADDVHPDLEALASVLVVAGYSGPRLVVDRAVSSAMADAARRLFELQIEPIDPRLAPRARPDGGLPALAFSGGADSSAALAILPRDTIAGFMRRIQPPGDDTPRLYRDDAALHACETLRQQGWNVQVIESDLEYLRTPLGFPTDWANGIGLVLMADHLRLRSVSWGVVAESAYRVGHEQFQDWAARRRTWADLFAAAGLHFDGPVAGVSEVGTTTLVSRSPIGAVTQSCIRGEVGKPCGNCWKCFRKSLLDAAISGRWPDDAELDRLFTVREVDHRLSLLPIPHENVIGWIAARYPGTHPKMRLLRERSVQPGLSLSWLEHWYSPSADLLDPDHRLHVERQLDDQLRRMSSDEETSFRGWDMTSWLAAESTIAAGEQLVGHPVNETPEERAARDLATRRRIAAEQKAAAEAAAIERGQKAPESGKRRKPAWLRLARKALRRIRQAGPPASS